MFDSEGWFHTGDIARILPSGVVQIIDRKKNYFKLSQGLYVAAENLEGSYGLSPFVNQIWIPGNSSKSYIVAVIVPNEAFVLAWAEEQAMMSSQVIPFETLCQSSLLHDAILRDFAYLHRDNSRPGYELIRGMVVETHEWTIESGFLTPTGKLKRNVLRAHYVDQLEQCYQGVEATTASLN